MTAAALLEDLRRRIKILESRPREPFPRLPPHPPRIKPLQSLADIEGARAAEYGARVTTHFEPGAKVGRVAPADALLSSARVAADLAGVETAPRGLLADLRIVDIETTGLAGGTGTLAFVVGVGRFDARGALTVDQLVLGAPGLEPRFLDEMLGLFEGASLLVTFNGRAFDAPLLKTRCILSRRAPGPLGWLPHLDLFPAARRLWRGRAGDCRLITLEERVLRRRRPVDLPGAMAPAAYTTFLGTGQVAPVGDVVAHNRDDIAGSAALLAAVLRVHEEPLIWAEDGGELLAVAEYRLRRGAADAALPILERALALARGPDLRRHVLTQMARVHRRARRFEAARAAWETYRTEFPGENLGYTELAKLLEHRARDHAAALAVAAAAPHPGAGDLSHRLSRLRRRLASRTL